MDHILIKFIKKFEINDWHKLSKNVIKYNGNRIAKVLPMKQKIFFNHPIYQKNESEYKIMKKIENFANTPNNVDKVVIDNHDILLMDFEGVSLFHDIKNVSDETMLSIIKEVLETLHCLQQKFLGFLHNDLHIGNILLHQKKITIIDYGYSNIPLIVENFEIKNNIALEAPSYVDCFPDNTKDAIVFLKSIEETLICKKLVPKFEQTMNFISKYNYYMWTPTFKHIANFSNPNEILTNNCEPNDNFIDEFRSKAKEPSKEVKNDIKNFMKKIFLIIDKTHMLKRLSLAICFIDFLYIGEFFSRSDFFSLFVNIFEERTWLGHQGIVGFLKENVSRQNYKTFLDRFSKMPSKIEYQLKCSKKLDNICKKIHSTCDINCKDILTYYRPYIGLEKFTYEMMANKSFI